jgi:PBP1b-binding outer membrane lipoprotein LpoB
MKKTIALVAFAGLTLAACSGGSDAPVPEVNETITNVDTTSEPENITDTPAPEPINTVTPTPTPPVTLSADEQTVEDATATGMTAKVNRDENGEEGTPAH